MIKAVQGSCERIKQSRSRSSALRFAVLESEPCTLHFGSPMKLLIVSGLSGSGKASPHTLEDCVIIALTTFPSHYWMILSTM